MKTKKKDKRVAHATMVWEREQLQAAMAAEQVDKAAAVIMRNRGELSDEEFAEVIRQIETRKKDIEDFLMSARDKYAAKLDELQVEAVITTEAPQKLVNLKDINANL